MYWVSLAPVSPLARVVSAGEGVVAFGLGGLGCCWLLVAVLVLVPQLLVLGVGLGVVGRWVLLGVGARHSWLRAWWVLLVGLPLCPSGVSGGPAAPLAEGRWLLFLGFSCVVSVCGSGSARNLVCCARLWGSCWWQLWRCVLCARAGVCAVCL